MAQGTKEPELDDHGSPKATPRFGINSDSSDAYDPQKTPQGNPADPRGDVAAGDSSDPRGDLQKREQENDSTDGKDSEKSERKSLGQDESSGYARLGGKTIPENRNLFSGVEKPSRLKSFRARFTRRRNGFLVAGGLVVFGGAAGFSVLQGPLQLLHVGQFLTNGFLSPVDALTEDRSLRGTYYYFRGQPEKGRLGYLGNKVADKFEARLLERNGIRPIYNANVGGRMVGYEIVDERLARNSGMLNEIENAAPEGRITQAKSVQGTEIRRGGSPIDPEARIFYLAPGTSAKTLRKVEKIASRAVATSIRGLGYLAYRTSIKRSGIKLSLLNILEENRDRRQNNRAENDNRRDIYGEGFTEQFKNAVDGNNTDVDVKGKKTKELFDKISSQIAGKTPAQAKVVTSTALKAAGPIATIGIFCTIDDIGEGADAISKANITKMLRLFWLFPTTAAGLQAGDVTLDGLGEITNMLYDKETGKHLTDAAPLREIDGKSPTGPQVPDEAKPSSKKLEQLFDANGALLDTPLTGIGLNLLPVPGIPKPTLGNTGCPAIEAVGDFPGVEQASAVALSGANATLALFGISSIDNMLLSLFTFIANGAVNTGVVGGELGALVAMGGHLAKADGATSMGGSAISPAQSVAIQEDLRIARLENMSTYEKYFDITNIDSFAGSSALSINKSGKDIPSTMANILNPTKWLFTPGSIFGPSKANAAYVADSEATFGMKDYGHPEFILNLFPNPYENAANVEPKLQELNEKYSKCFGVEVINDPENGLSLNSQTLDLKKLEEDAEYEVCRKNSASNIESTESMTAEQREFHSYGTYIADVRSNLVNLCGSEARGVDPEVDHACDTSDIGSIDPNAGQQNNESSSDNDLIPSPNDLGKNSDHIECADGSNDLGIVTTLYDGDVKKEPGPLKIRLCQIVDIPGFGNNTQGTQVSGGATVDARVSKAWVALGRAAKEDGVSLSSFSSFRLAHSCGGKGDGISCAKPGKSFHQTGLAIDFDNMRAINRNAGTCANRVTFNSPQYNWMRENANKFGVKQYSVEAWHWDFGPFDNRC